jgi:predicted NAD/FAD-binding protein
MRVAIVGAGVSGLGCAWRLLQQAPADLQLTVYEAQPRLGGHTHTVDVTVDGAQFGVDTGFLVFNHRTYPHLLRLFADLQVPTVASEMSFGVSLPLATGGRRLEWAGSSLATVFAQKRNLLWPPFLHMLRDIVRFNRAATALAQPGDGAHPDASLTLGEFLDRHGYGRPFVAWYLLPMAAAIWSCPVATMRGYPVSTFARFCHNHGLLQVVDRPQWYTVRGGARDYVDKIAARLPDLRRDDPVHEVRRLPDGSTRVTSRTGPADYDHVVLACHSDESLALLRDADAGERGVLAAVRYQPNRAVLHTDVQQMPRLRSVWSAWNYLSDGADLSAESARVAVTYWLNRLQPLPTTRPVLLTLNPLVPPLPEHVIGAYDYAHPVFDAAAVAAQRALPEVQGRRGVWLAGAWTGFGFHEDGLKSGVAVAEALLARTADGRAQPVARAA